MSRTITTLKERLTLPRGTVIRDAAGVAWVRRRASWKATTPIEDDQWIEMPATVLHDPSAPAPAPTVVPEAAVEAATAAVRRERAFAAAAAFGVPLDDVPECAEMIARAALTAALPLLTAAPSATRDEVAEVMTTARYPEGVWSHGYRECPEADDEVVADALLARFTITPKEDR